MSQHELDRAVRESLAQRPAPTLTIRRQVILQAVRDFDDERLVPPVPYVHQLLRDFQQVGGP